MKTHPPIADGVALVDFDGTIVPWGQLNQVPEPIPGAPEAIDLLRRAGYRVGIFTSRLSATWHRAEGRDPVVGIAQQMQIIRTALFKHNIPFDFITGEKVPAEIYLDDKAMRVSKARPLIEAVAAFLFDSEAL